MSSGGQGTASSAARGRGRVAAGTWNPPTAGPQLRAARLLRVPAVESGGVATRPLGSLGASACGWGHLHTPDRRLQTARAHPTTPGWGGDGLWTVVRFSARTGGAIIS